MALREGRVGGAERLVLDSLDRLSRDFEVEVVTTPLPWERGSPLTPTDSMRRSKVLVGRTDLLYTHLFLPGLLARLGRALGSRARWVHAVHFEAYEGLSLGRLRAWLDHRWIYPAADRVVAVSPRVANAMRRRGLDPGGIRLLENALDMSPDPKAGTRHPHTGPLVLGTVAMLRAEKGVDTLIRALGLLLDRGVDARLQIAGDGPERDRLADLASTLKLSERVEFLGYVSPVQAAYRGFDVYVQPSHAEAFGLAALESLRYGLPLVVSPEGNLPACAGEGSWGVVADSDLPREEALADALERAISDLDLWRARAESGRGHWAARLDPLERGEREAALLRGALLPRVAHVAPVITQAGGGGLQRQILLQTRALDDAGHRIFLLQRPDPELRPSTEPTEGRLPWAHVTAWEAGSERLSGHGSSIRERWLGLRFVMGALPRLLLRRSRYDVIHAHQLFSPTLIGALVKTLTGTPLVVRVAASGRGVGEVSQLQRLPFRRLRMWALHRIDAAIALTEGMREELLEAGLPEERVHVVPNAVRLPAEHLEQPRRRQGPYTLLFVGRISEEKCIDTAIRAVGALARSRVDVRLRLVGRSDPDRDRTAELRELAGKLGVTDRVEWAGYTPDPTAERSTADAFLLPSRSEGMSNALLEAAAAGMVCVASDIAQNRAVTGDSGARYFPVGDHEALADLIRELVADRVIGGSLARELASAARARVQRRNAPERIAERLSSIYQAVSRREAVS